MNEHPTPTPLSAAQREALEARFALRLSARLDAGAQTLPHDIGERLRVARERAVASARVPRASAGRAAVADAQTATTVALAPAGAPGVGGLPMLPPTLELFSPATSEPRRPRVDEPLSWGWRIAAVIPALALLAGLWTVHRVHQDQQAQAAAEVDVELLTDELPPDAYADPGFEEYLREEMDLALRPMDAIAPDADGDLIAADTPPAVLLP